MGILNCILARSRGDVDEREINIAGDLFDGRVGRVCIRNLMVVTRGPKTWGLWSLQSDELGPQLW
jgi:hypothetical protein